jgi:hypothetical protein
MILYDTHQALKTIPAAAVIRIKVNRANLQEFYFFASCSWISMALLNT